MQVQPSLVLLQKTLLNIEGLGRQLYPQLNLWDTAKPFLERWVNDRYSPQTVMRKLQQHAPSWLEQLPQLPEAVMESLLRQREGQREAEAELIRLREQRATEKRRARRRFMAVTACLLAAATLLPSLRTQLVEAPAITWALLAIAAGLAWPGQAA
jgi:ubiquinone biosynthesis protein